MQQIYLKEDKYLETTWLSMFSASHKSILANLFRLKSLRQSLQTFFRMHFPSLQTESFMGDRWWACSIQFNSILYLNSHRALQIYCFHVIFIINNLYM